MENKVKELQDEIDRAIRMLNDRLQREQVILEIIDHVENPASKPGWMTATKGIRTIKQFLTFKEKKDEQIIKE